MWTGLPTSATPTIQRESPSISMSDVESPMSRHLDRHPACDVTQRYQQLLADCAVWRGHAEQQRKHLSLHVTIQVCRDIWLLSNVGDDSQVTQHSGYIYAFIYNVACVA